jgi:hypothetical protein
MSFKEKGYQIVRGFLDENFALFIQDYFYLRIKAGHANTGDLQAPFSYSFYADPLIETILEASCESLSKICGFTLLPTYSYTRLYGNGDELVKHRDRPSCEISATLALGIPNGEDINPIYFSKNEDSSDAKEILLRPGDLCLYRGCDLYHWRPPFTQRWYLQSFLHYVNADGPYKDYIYDKRTYLGVEKK